MGDSITIFHPWTNLINLIALLSFALKNVRILLFIRKIYNNFGLHLYSHRHHHLAICLCQYLEHPEAADALVAKCYDLECVPDGPFCSIWGFDGSHKKFPTCCGKCSKKDEE
eukprot:TRINITY_DN25451_c2_g1_i1.p1 TRINITY_DN25451_c2_g1~~TRINITY_DN25451_c2_g1_i1.p1  ORF type:complete len:112 (+),score=7.63 TRINITY_DN25451_c2_g1_i1:821-1156(+)